MSNGEDVTIVLRPRATDPIHTSVEKAGGSAEPQIDPEGQAIERAKELAKASRWADAERTLSSIPRESFQTPDTHTLQSLVAFKLGKFQDAAYFAGLAEAASVIARDQKFWRKALLTHQLRVFANVALNGPELEKAVMPSFDKALAIGGTQAAAEFRGAMQSCIGLGGLQLERDFREALRQRCVRSPSSLSW